MNNITREILSNRSNSVLPDLKYNNGAYGCSMNSNNEKRDTTSFPENSDDFRSQSPRNQAMDKSKNWIEIKAKIDKKFIQKSIVLLNKLPGVFDQEIVFDKGNVDVFNKEFNETLGRNNINWKFDEKHKQNLVSASNISRCDDGNTIMGKKMGMSNRIQKCFALNLKDAKKEMQVKYSDSLCKREQELQNILCKSTGSPRVNSASRKRNQDLGKKKSRKKI